MPKLPECGLATTQKGTDLLLPGGTISHMAQLQTDRARSNALQRETRRDNRIRRAELKAAAAPIIEQAFREKSAQTIPDIRSRIEHELMAYNVTRDEAERAMKDNRLIELGQLTDEHGKASRDRYVTTEKNIQIERDIVERMKIGKGVFEKQRHLDKTAADQILQKVLDAKNEGKPPEQRIKPTEDQHAVLLHILSSKDRFLGVQGLAGTGKTFSMTLLRECCEKANIPIYGASLGNAAKNGLERESKIKSFTIHKLLNELEKGKFTEKKKSLKELAVEVGHENGVLPRVRKKEPPRPKREGLDASTRQKKQRRGFCRGSLDAKQNGSLPTKTVHCTTSKSKRRSAAKRRPTPPS